MTFAAQTRAANPAPSATFTSIATNATTASGINAVANARNTITSYGNYQFAVFYDSDRYANISRRVIGANNWQTVRTPYQLADNAGGAGIYNDHCHASIAIDGNAHLHMAFGMHNAHPMKYLISTELVTVGDWSATNFGATAKWARQAPFDWDTRSDADPDRKFSYPELYNIPGSKDIIYSYRSAPVGGGSGNGDLPLVRYHADAPAAQKFTLNQVIDGDTSNVSAYTNNLVHDSQGRLLMSWVWRETADYLTNHDVLFARSPDDGKSWYDAKGQLITHDVATKPLAPGNVMPAVAIGQNNSLINSTTMAVDSQDRPLIATWYAPHHADGDETRQYMLDYFDGNEWKQSQITQRPNEGGLKTGDNVREMGRPLLLVDQEDRALVLMRDRANGNKLTVAFSKDYQHWDFVDLVADNLGDFEPGSFDRALWDSQNKLNLFYQPIGVGSPVVSVLEWDAKAYFAAIPEPAGVSVCLMLCLGMTARRRR
ncbi:MAG TPA: BNR-4 repeat-containing protein [Tepidisphaeraceae bacterium]